MVIPLQLDVLDLERRLRTHCERSSEWCCNIQTWNREVTSLTIEIVGTRPLPEGEHDRILELVIGTANALALIP